MLNVCKRSTFKSWRAKWDQICWIPTIPRYELPNPHFPASKRKRKGLLALVGDELSSTLEPLPHTRNVAFPSFLYWRKMFLWSRGWATPGLIWQQILHLWSDLTLVEGEKEKASIFWSDTSSRQFSRHLYRWIVYMFWIKFDFRYT